jgi:hypothetical protein
MTYLVTVLKLAACRRNFIVHDALAPVVAYWHKLIAGVIRWVGEPFRYAWRILIKHAVLQIRVLRCVAAYITE